MTMKQRHLQWQWNEKTTNQNDNGRMTSPMTNKQNDNETKWEGNNAIYNDNEILTKNGHHNDNGNVNET